MLQSSIMLQQKLIACIGAGASGDIPSIPLKNNQIVDLWSMHFNYLNFPCHFSIFYMVYRAVLAWLQL